MAYEAPVMTLQTFVSAKRQTDPITEATPVHATAPSDVLNIHTEENPFQLEPNRIEDNTLTGSFTSESDIIGGKIVPVRFQHHLHGVGDAGSNIEPNWIRVIECCGHSTASGSSGGSSSFVMSPKSQPSDVNALTMRQYTAKTLAKAMGIYGTAQLEYTAKALANMTFDGRGKYVAGATEDPYPATIVRQTKNNKFVQSLGLVIGTYTPKATSIRFDLGAAPAEEEDVNSTEGIYSFYNSGRRPTCDILLAAPEDQIGLDIDGAGNSFWDALVDGVTQNISWTLGAASTNWTLATSLNAWQLVGQGWETVNGRRMIRTSWKGRNATADGEYTMTHKEKHA